MSHEIELPPFGITVLPPWGQCIVLLDKDIENRGGSILAQIARYRGPMLLSQSAWKRDHDVESEAIWRSLAKDGLASHLPVPKVRTWAGKAFAVANLVGIIGPTVQGRKWHVPGEYGLELENVRLVALVDCSGAVGFWRTTWCNLCGRIAADGWIPSKKHPCSGCHERRQQCRMPPGLRLRIIESSVN